MKTTNKILLMFIVLLFVSFTEIRLVIHSKTELIPWALDKKFEQKTIGIQKFLSLEVNGNYYVHVNKSDFDSLKIWGPDNLVNKFTDIVNNGNAIKINSKVDLSKYGSRSIEIWINTSSLESISVSGGAIVSAESFNGNKFDFVAKDFSIINCEDCNYTNTNFTLKDKARVSLDMTQNAVVDVQDTAALFLTIDNGNISGKTFGDGELILFGKTNSNTVEKVENKSRGTK